MFGTFPCFLYNTSIGASYCGQDPVGLLIVREFRGVSHPYFCIYGRVAVLPSPLTSVDAIAAAIARNDDGADVIGLQEAFNRSTTAKLRKALSAAGLVHQVHFAAGYGLPFNAEGSGLLVGSRHPIVDTAYHRFTTNGKWYKVHHLDHQCGKGVGMVRLRLPGDTGIVDVFNTHLIAQYHDVDGYASERLLQAFETAQFIRHMARAPLVALMCDLNANPTSLAYRLLAGLSCLQDGYSAPGGCGGSLTDATFGAPTNSFVSKSHPCVRPQRCDIKQRLDYVLCWMDPTWRLTASSMVFTERFRPPGSSSPINLSDHFGVCCEFTVNAAHANMPAFAPPPPTPAQVGLLQDTNAVLHTALQEVIGRHRMQLRVACVLLVLSLAAAAGAAWRPPARNPASVGTMLASLLTALLILVFTQLHLPPKYFYVVPVPTFVAGLALWAYVGLSAGWAACLYSVASLLLVLGTTFAVTAYAGTSQETRAYRFGLAAIQVLTQSATHQTQ